MNGALLAIAYHQLTMGALVDDHVPLAGSLEWRWMQPAELGFGHGFGLQSHLRFKRHESGLLELHDLSAQAGVLGIEVARHRGEYRDFQFPGWWDMVVDDGGSERSAWQLHVHALPTFASFGSNDLLPSDADNNTFIGLGLGLGVEGAVSLGPLALFGEATLRGRSRLHGDNLGAGPSRSEVWAEALVGVRSGRWALTGFVEPYGQVNRRVLGDAPPSRSDLTAGVALQWRAVVDRS
jgi:hypothetical protein